MGNKQSSSSTPSSDSSGQATRPAETTTTSSNATNTTPSNNNTSYYTLIKNSYQQLVNAIIRPPRCRYSVEQLGPIEFKFCGKRFQRIDFTLTNSRNLKFECSLWEPVSSDRHSERLPCVIYMHGNSSARIESLSTLSVILGMGATLLAIDFAGSGLSEGEYVSLGAFEKDDLAAAIEYLRNSQKTSTIALWGRSMGAATALLHAERDPSIAGMILDSAFSDLVILAEDMVEKGRQQGFFAPSFLVYVAIKFVRSSVQKAAGFDIRTLSPIEHADRCFVPALFIAAENDQFVLPKHSQSIHDKYGGDKNLIMVEGDHNSPRPRYIYDSIAIFLQQTLQLPPAWVLPGCEYYIRRLPWASSGQTAASTSAQPPHPQRSVMTLTDANVSGSDRHRLQAYIQKQQQQQKDNNKPVMYEVEDDADDHGVLDGSSDISSLMSPNDTTSDSFLQGLSDSETELLMLQMMDEDEQLALVLAQSVSDAAATAKKTTTVAAATANPAAHSLDQVDSVQYEHEVAMQQNVENSLFSLLNGGQQQAPVASKPASATHRPLAKTKAHPHPSIHTTSTSTSSSLSLTPQYVAAEAASSTLNRAPMSPSALQAAESLLRQQQQLQQISPNSSQHSSRTNSKTSSRTSSWTEKSTNQTKKRIFFAEDDEDSSNTKLEHQQEDNASNIPASSEGSLDTSATESNHNNNRSVTLPSFPSAPSVRDQANQLAMSAKSSFHTFHNVFDQVENDQELRRSSPTVSESAVDVGIQPSSSILSPRSSKISASQLLSMADPFEDEIEEEIEIVDEHGRKQIIKQRRKKVDEFADDNETPIQDDEIVGMDETLEELSMNVGSNSAEFFSHLESKSASAQSSHYNLPHPPLEATTATSGLPHPAAVTNSNVADKLPTPPSQLVAAAAAKHLASISSLLEDDDD